MKRHFPFIKTGYQTIILLFIGIAMGELSPLAASVNKSLKFSLPDRDTQGDLPDNSVPLGSRDDCPVEVPTLTALVPHQGGSFGYTTSDRPTLWVYNPFNLNENSARLEVDNAAGEEIEDYETHVVGRLDEPGVISLPFPDDVPPLAVGETYNWHFLVYCGNVAHQGRPLTVRGSILRVEEPETVSDNQIWYDRLTEVGTELRNDPDNPELARQWANLMEFVEGDGIAEQSIQDCCRLERPQWP